MSLRTGGKAEIPLAGAPSSSRSLLDSVSDELRTRAESVVSQLVSPLPIEDNNPPSPLDAALSDGVVYEIAFEGNDSDAELLEKKTGLTLLGESAMEFDEPRPCVVTGKSTTKRQHIARMY